MSALPARLVANWHHIVKANAPLQPAELTLKSGCINGMDMKDGMDYHDAITEDGTFIETASYQQASEEFSDAINWIRQLGLNPDRGRLDHYRRVLDYWKDTYKTAPDEQLKNS